MSNGRGGMAKNPFGGHERMDKCNLQGPSMLGGQLVDVFSGVPGERTMLAESLKDACSNYLFFGLGQNGTSADEFWFSVEYLFRCRASRPETWQCARYMRDTFFDEAQGKRVTRVLTLTDEQLKLACIDAQWDLLEMPFPVERFVSALRAERKRLIGENRKQIETFIALLNNRSISRSLLRGETIPMKFFSQDLDEVLTEPKNPDDVSELIRYQPRRYRQQCARLARWQRQGPAPGTRFQFRPDRLAEAERAQTRMQPLEGDHLAFETDSTEFADAVGSSSPGLSA